MKFVCYLDILQILESIDKIFFKLNAGLKVKQKESSKRDHFATGGILSIFFSFQNFKTPAYFRS